MILSLLDFDKRLILGGNVLEYKEHKKMYKVGKNWAVATLVSAGILMGATTVHADTTTVSATDNDVTTTQPVAVTPVETVSAENGASQPGTTEHPGDVAQPGKQINDQTTQTKDQYGLTPDAAKAVQGAGMDPAKLTQDQVTNLDKINFKKSGSDKTGTQMTYEQYRAIANDLINRDHRYSIPFFNAKEIQNMPASHTRDAETNEIADLDIWDSWPVQDANTGEVVNWNGYQLAVAMMGIPAKNDSHIYLLYNKYGNNNLADWKNAGPIFGFNQNSLHQQWSGSATKNSDGTIELFYTDVDTSDHGLNNQRIAAANLTLTVNPDGTVSINKVNNNHIIFAGDGYHYQTYAQWRATNKGADNVAMRDAHVIEVDGQRYLVFEASTGTENYQGEDQIYNWQNYGDNAKTNIENFFGILNNDDMTSRASWANAALGILRLNNDESNPKLADVYTPLVSAPMVSDEIERPDIVKLNGKYYLFAATRLNRGTGDDLWSKADKTIGDNVVMIGYVSDHLTYGYKPLNGNGVVLTSSVPFNWRTSTYSYYAMPIAGDDSDVLITAYMTNRGYVAGQGNRSTWAPSFLVKINNDGTTQVLSKATNQGDWIWDSSSENDKMLAKSIDEAKLTGEAVPTRVPDLSSGSKKDDPDPVPGYQPGKGSWAVGPDDVAPELPEFPLPDKPTPTTPDRPEKPTTPDPDNPGKPTSNTPGTPEQPLNPGQPVISGTPGTSDVPSGKPAIQQTNNVKNDPATLPQTGNESGVVALYVGSLFALLGLAGIQKRVK